MIAHKSHTLRNKSGFTLVEIMVAMTIMVMVTLGMCALFVDSSRSSGRTQTRADVDNAVAIATEKVNDALMEARTVSIAANGRSITFYRPVLDNATGHYTSSAKTTEATARSLYATGTNLYSSDSAKPILKNIPTTGAIFSYGINNKEIVVQLQSSQAAGGNQTASSTVTIRIQPRNM